MHIGRLPKSDLLTVWILYDIHEQCECESVDWKWRKERIVGGLQGNIEIDQPASDSALAARDH